MNFVFGKMGRFVMFWEGICLTINEAVICFFLYSFFGWVYETALVSIREKQWSNRGFLIGPICPIYGFGALIFIFIGTGLNLWLTFLVCMVSSAILEYGTAYALEKFFHASWWDYSNMPLNLNGYICLPASLLFGTAGVVVSHFLQPVVFEPIQAMPDAVQNIGALLLTAVVSADATLTVSSLSDFVGKMKELEERANQAIADKYDELESTVSGKLANVKALSLSSAMKDFIIEQELKSANFKVNWLQSSAVKTIRSFKNEGAHTENRNRIKDAMLRVAKKAKAIRRS